MRHSLLVLAILTGCQAVVVPDGGQVTPQRPTVSTNTDTTTHGYLEIEAGGYIDPGDFVDTPSTLKLGTSPTSEVFIGFAPYQVADVRGSNDAGIGDFRIGFRQRLQEETEELPSTAFQLVTKIPESDEDDGRSTGRTDFFARGIATKHFEHAKVTGNYELGLLGTEKNGNVDIQHLFAIVADFPIDGELAAFNELACIWIPEQDEEQLSYLGGLRFLMSPSTVFDGAISLGLTDDAPGFVLLFGVTHSIGRVVRKP